jgi:hypothetical protein
MLLRFAGASRPLVAGVHCSGFAIAESFSVVL